MEVATKLLGANYSILLCCRPMQRVTYCFASESQKYRKELLPSEQRFDEVAIELRTKQTFLNVIGEFGNRLMVPIIQYNL